MHFAPQNAYTLITCIHFRKSVQPFCRYFVVLPPTTLLTSRPAYDAQFAITPKSCPTPTTLEATITDPVMLSKRCASPRGAFFDPSLPVFFFLHLYFFYFVLTLFSYTSPLSLFLLKHRVAFAAELAPPQTATHQDTRPLSLFSPPPRSPLFVCPLLSRPSPSTQTPTTSSARLYKPRCWRVPLNAFTYDS